MKVICAFLIYIYASEMQFCQLHGADRWLR